MAKSGGGSRSVVINGVRWNTMGTGTFDGWRVENAKGLAADAFAVAVAVRGPNTGIIVASRNRSLSHNEIIRAAGIKNEDERWGSDNYVRFRSEGSKIMGVDVNYAGVANMYDMDSNDAITAAMTNIHRATRRMVARGLPKSTIIRVYNASGNGDYTFKAGDA